MKLIVVSFILLFIVILCKSIPLPKDYQETLATEKAIIKFDPLTLVDEGYLKITTKEAELVNFDLNPPERRFLKLIKTLLATGQPVYVVIDKARQWGGTTTSVGIGYSIISQTPNMQGMIIADGKDGSGDILKKAKLMQRYFLSDYPHLATKDNINSRRELAFDGINSNILVETADNVDAGQKYTIQFLLASEVSKYKHAGLMFAGLFGALAKIKGSIKILESTPNGIGDFFYEIVMEAQDNTEKYKDGDFSEYDGEPILFFVPWMEFPAYTKDFKSDIDKQNLINSLEDDEKDLLKVPYITIDGYKSVTYEQLNWRRWMIKNEYKGDLDQFNQYYASNVDIGFLASGRMAFDPKRCKEIYNYTLTQTYQTGILEPKKSEPKVIDFFEQRNGEWKIWQFPEKEKYTKHPVDYVLTVDPAGQMEIEGNTDGKKGDYGTIGIFRRRQIGELKDHPQVRLEQVAEFRSRMAPDLLADEAYHGALAYGIKMVFPEANSYGLTTVDHLKHRIGVYVREQYDERSKKVTKKLGWMTTKATKPGMISELAASIRERTTLVRSTTMAKELSTYIIAADGTTNAQEGCFDDTVIEVALAIQADLRIPRKSMYSQAVQVRTQRG